VKWQMGKRKLRSLTDACAQAKCSYGDIGRAKAWRRVVVKEKNIFADTEGRNGN